MLVDDLPLDQESYCVFNQTSLEQSDMLLDRLNWNGCPNQGCIALFYVDIFNI